MAPKAGPVRCAIYTRKSTDHGLELEFNSLDAQREACEAYIKSQQHERWQVLPQRYDDPAYSGGSLDRPALQELLAAIDAGLVDIIVVYKIDRLTRSLADFATLVELFDRKAISFVAVTQQFNTTTSMGRLTLNVLLSFAQFERELSSERVRDKIAASRKKGKWTGGSVPLGYDTIDKKLVVNADEAAVVRTIFQLYLELRSVPKLIEELDRRNIVTKTRQIRGETTGGVPFNYGSLIYLLKNRTYLGETGHAGTWFAGEHEPILERSLFDAVQVAVKENAGKRANARGGGNALLAGLLFDDRGNRMSPGYTVKEGVRYPFYVSTAVLKGRKSSAGSVARVSAPAIERAVVDAVKAVKVNPDIDSKDLVDQFIDRIMIASDKLTISLKDAEAPIELLWAAAASRGRASITEPKDDGSPQPREELVQAVVRAHVWIKALTDGTCNSIEALADAANVHPKVLRHGIRLAFLAPDLTAAIMDGTQPVGLKVSDFQKTIPLSWHVQREMFGISNRHMPAM